MFFSNRWVPIEVMDTILLLWAVAVLILALIGFRLGRATRPKTHAPPKGPGARKKKRHR